MINIIIKFRQYHPKTGMEYFDWLPADRNENETWMQYTGLKDKSGKEIYEGDIIESKKHRLFVEYSNDWCAFMAIERHGLNDGQAEYCYLADHKNSEIIGNIYENPNLLST